MLEGIESIQPAPTKSAEKHMKGHPDAVCNLVANMILTRARDICLPLYTNDDDPLRFPRVAIESLAKGTKEGGVYMVAGELSVPKEVEHDLDIESIVRDTIASIGYTRQEDGFWNGLYVPIYLTKQSEDIKRGVDDNQETHKDFGAGDQGSMCGYAVAGEGTNYMPMPITIAGALADTLTELRETGVLPYLRPDGKTQVTVGYNEKGQPINIDDLTISVSHSREANLDDLQHDVMQHVVVPVLDSFHFDIPEQKKISINPTGRFEIHGPLGDAGVTGRKIIADAYGVRYSHGGGNWNGKDWTKVDMAGAMAARFVAKNIVAHGLAQFAYVEVTYKIGLPDPKVVILTYPTSPVIQQKVEEFVDKIMDFKVKTIIQQLRLWEQDYSQLAHKGWVGTNCGQSWEKIVDTE